MFVIVDPYAGIQNPIVYLERRLVVDDLIRVGWRETIHGFALGHGNPFGFQRTNVNSHLLTPIAYHI